MRYKSLHTCSYYFFLLGAVPLKIVFVFLTFKTKKQYLYAIFFVSFSTVGRRVCNLVLLQTESFPFLFSKSRRVFPLFSQRDCQKLAERCGKNDGETVQSNKKYLNGEFSVGELPSYRYIDR